MEPVPETESLEEFRSSPVPSLRLQPSPFSTITTATTTGATTIPHAQSISSSNLENSSGSSATSTATVTTTNSDNTSPATNEFEFTRGSKSLSYRRSNEARWGAELSSSGSPLWSSQPTFALPYRPRTASPLSGSHARSKSTSLASPMPSMSRTRSMPGVDGAGRILSAPLLRPASPSGSPNGLHRQRRKPADEMFPPSSPIRLSVLESEKRTSSTSSGSGSVTSSGPSGLFGPSTPSTPSMPSMPHSISTSPLYRYEPSPINYSFPTSYPPSSVPSTPTSIRSRSPSISSLETIPDSPDAEEAALEDERIAKLKMAATSESDDGVEEPVGDTRGRGSLDVPSRGRTLAMGTRDKRKRWSVCGAERRGDLDLETIWED